MQVLASEQRTCARVEAAINLLYKNITNTSTYTQVLVYKGHMRKSGACAEDDAAGQSILFTNDRRVVARERQNVYVHFKVNNAFLPE